MIDNIFKGQNRIITSKELCLKQLEELKRKKNVIRSLIQEYSIKTKLEKWDFSPISLLCESHVYIEKTIEMLNRWKYKNDKKSEIKISNSDSIVYESYCKSLKKNSSDLKNFFSICLIPEQNLM
jgi:hypothetical protein